MITYFKVTEFKMLANGTVKAFKSSVIANDVIVQTSNVFRIESSTKEEYDYYQKWGQQSEYYILPTKE
jgi:hypothetical protein